MTKTKKRILIKEALLVLTTLIWGLAFIAQRIGGQYLDAFSFNFLRNVVATIFILLLMFIKYLINKNKPQNNKQELNICKNNNYKKNLLLGGLLIGIALATAMSFQQLGINLEGAGKSGFITALYIVFVPVIGLLFGRKIKPLILIALVLALTGLYLINVNSGGFSFSKGTIYLFLCALCYSAQIMLIDKFSKGVDVIQLSCVEFGVATIVLLPFALIKGSMNIESIVKAIPAILFLGVFSSGIAYTLQIYAQTEVNVNIACIIMSLESLFSLIFGMIILSEKHGVIQLIGCLCILLAVILSQLDFKNKKDV